MTTFRVRHRTSYAYDAPVEFGPHRLMARPRDGHDMRLLESNLSVYPLAEIRWAFDTFGNSVAYLTFLETASELVIDSVLTLRRYGYDDPIERLARHSGPFPFLYSDDERVDLAPLMALSSPGDRAVLRGWLAQAVPDVCGEAIALLEALSTAIYEGMTYIRREQMGVQTPGETIAMASGTCRDFALLFIEAARFYGFGARFVTGYLYDQGSAADGISFSGGGSTHAWADVFVPGAGWVEFDPTNRIVAGRNLLRVAVTRTPAQALPLSGTFSGEGASFLGMKVSVQVDRVE